MISELKIRNFKSLESVDLKLGHFNLLVGANASGKSNFIDALRFLQGVANGFTLDEILDGKPPSSTNVKWDGIRGGSRFMGYRTRDGKIAEHVDFSVGLCARPAIPEGSPSLNFEMSVSPHERVFKSESVEITRDFLAEYSVPQDLAPMLSAPICSTERLSVESSEPKEHTSSFFAWILEPGTQRDLNLHEHAGRAITNQLANMQHLNPNPAVLHQYSKMFSRLGEQGENFPAIIHGIELAKSKGPLLEWLKEMRPDEVDDIFLAPGANNDLLFFLKESGNLFPAPVLSDGTLRFIALAAAFFQPSMPKVLVIEEIEKGLHPSRLRLLLELMRSQSKRTGTQVFATTHSPTLLNWLTEEDRKTTFVCTRDAASGATKMRPLSDVPKLEELIKKNYNLDQLFEEGWLESVLHES